MGMTVREVCSTGRGSVDACGKTSEPIGDDQPACKKRLQRLSVRDTGLAFVAGAGRYGWIGIERIAIKHEHMKRVDAVRA